MENNICGVYEIKNIITGNVYIGSSINAKQRFSEHKRALKRGSHTNKHLQRAWDKHGEKHFLFVLKRVVFEKKFLIFHEQNLIDKYHPEYNILSNAGNSLGFRQPSHVGKAVGRANKNRIHSEETRKKLATNKGKKFSSEHKNKISAGRKTYFF